MKNFIFTLDLRSRVKVFWTVTVATLVLVGLLAVCLSCGKGNPVTPPGDEITLAKIQKARSVSLGVTGGLNMLDNNGNLVVSETTPYADGFVFDLGSFNLMWNGTSFSGSNEVKTFEDTTITTVSGSISSDAKTLISMEVTLHSDVGLVINDLHAIISNVSYSTTGTASGFTFYDYIMTGDLVESHTNILYYIYWHFSRSVDGVPYGVYDGNPRNRLKYVPGAWQAGTKKIYVNFSYQN